MPPPRRPVALLPVQSEFDAEAEAASTAGLPVLRYDFNQQGQLHVPAEQTASLRERYGTTCEDEAQAAQSHQSLYAGILRGWMQLLSRRSALDLALQEQCSVRLVVTPSQYAAAHHYPEAYPHLQEMSPRALWVPVPHDDPSELDTALTAKPSIFAAAVEEVLTWGRSDMTGEPITHLMLKDYVKSTKAHASGAALMKVSIQEEGREGLEAAARALVVERSRTADFNAGVVFKEHVALQQYRTDRPGSSGVCLNEWRLWFVQGSLVSAAPNSFQDGVVEIHCSGGVQEGFGEGVPCGADDGCAALPQPPPAVVVRAATAAARAIGSPYLTVDVAETETEQWVALEAGDGGVCGPAPGQDLVRHWRCLHDAFIS